MSKFPVARYAAALSVGERDRFANIALRARDHYQAITAFERQRRHAS